MERTAVTRIGLIPGCLALLPQYASLEDPVGELRAACAALVGWLGEDVQVVGSGQGRRVAQAVLGARTVAEGGAEPSYLVVANGSACRSERAPGHLDERSRAFDDALRDALLGPTPEAMRDLDRPLAAELLADLTAVPELAGLLTGARTVAVDYDDAPYGVQYWVARWSVDGARPAAPVSVGA